MAKNCEVLTPDLVKESLATIIRVTNNVIFYRNESEGKSNKNSMGTTLVMALQLPQFAMSGNTHEVYVANVGDSRAYWITSNSCKQLTVDDDWVTRGVKLGKSFYRQALQNSLSGKVTQALGIKDSYYLEPKIQRFMIVEDGVLLLCSDGLSDYNFLENNWQNFIPDVLQNKVSLQNALESLLRLAIEKNGHDNITIVATCYVVSPQESVVVNLGDLESTTLTNDIPDASALVLTASSMLGKQPEIFEGELGEEMISECKDFDWKWLFSLIMVVVVGVSSYVVTQWILQPEFNPPLRKDPPVQE
jgi:serine/threonine protein phosphatase PrpC